MTIESARKTLSNASRGEHLELLLSDGRQLTGEVEDAETTHDVGEPRQRGLEFVTGGGEFVYDVTVDLDDEGAAPTVTRTVFADTAAELGRISEDDVDDPNAYVILDEGEVVNGEPIPGDDTGRSG